MTESYMARLGDTLADSGFHILPIIPGKKAPGRFTQESWRPYTEWSRHCGRATTGFELQVWSKWPDAGIGVACGNVCAVDIDVLDAEVAHRLEKLARDMLGDTPALRIGKAPKRTLAYRAATPFPGRKRHPVEVLGHGQQFVAYAIHPDTGQPYTWPHDDLAALDVSDLPEITEEQAHAFLAAAWEALPENLRQSSLERDAPRSEWAGPSDQTGTLEAVTDALRHIPNDDLNRSDWIRIGLALKGALGEDGRSLWLNWSRQSSKSGKSGKDDTPERAWRSFAPGSIGAGTIYWHAEQRGWRPEPGVALNPAKADAADWAADLRQRSEAEGITPKPQTVAASVAETAPQEIALLPGEEGAEPVADPDEAVKIAKAETEDLLLIDGALDYFVQWATETSNSPQPFLALGAALAMVGAVAGRRYKVGGGNGRNLRTNVYSVGIAGSGGGKEHARQCAMEALFAAGLQNYLGGENFASGQGLIASLEKHPSRLFQIDEFGKWLTISIGDRAAPHLLEAWDNLTKLFSRAGSIMPGKEYAKQSGNEAKPRIDLIQPCACVYGTTTPEQFWQALGKGALLDGSLARWLVFLSPDSYPDDVMPSGDEQPPQHLVAALREIAAGKPGHGGVLAEGPLRPDEADPYPVPVQSYAEDAFAEFRALQRRWLREQQKTAQAPFLARMVEHAWKIALIRAVGRQPQDPEITEPDAQWAWALTCHCVGTVLRDAHNFIAESKGEAQINKVLAYIRSHGGKVTKSTLLKATRLKTRELGEIIGTLQDTGEIAEVRVAHGGSGRPSVVYRLTEAA